ncbi:Holliday junction branch migration protein RuvA [bacterium]|nr:MAG: Holliday junction branch migration protein RuvA [bacterium]
MIASLTGILQKKLPTYVIVNCAGVGYGVTVTATTSSSLPEIGKQAFLHIYHHITEIGQSLFGFADEAEKETFELLITVKGIGPKMGITILSGMSGDQIRETIARADSGLLSKIPGIGKKTAERIILELKDKVGSISASSGVSTSGNGNPIGEDAIAALVSLGYKSLDAGKAVQHLLKTERTFKNASDLVREALKMMNA